MRVLVAGDHGYIGAVLAPFLPAAGHEVDRSGLNLYEDRAPTRLRSRLPARSGNG
jgi:nucleoside-diphosphate-sugar epimerase